MEKMAASGFSNRGKKLKILCLIPPSSDFLCASVIEGLNHLGHQVNAQVKMNGAKWIPTDLLQAAIESDFLILFSNVEYAKRKKWVLDHKLGEKTVYVDGSDYYYLEDADAPKRFPIIFKRELFTRKYSLLESLGEYEKIRAYVSAKIRGIMHDMIVDESKLIALPFAAEDGYFRKNSCEKDIDISCTLRTNKAGRKAINDAVQAVKANSIVGPPSAGMFQESSSNLKDKYYEVLARSRMSVSYPGAGFDTGRFWEILANRCLLFSPPIRIKMPNPFVPFEHFIPYTSPEDLKQKIEYYLKYEDKRKKIAETGYKHLLKYHTSKKRAEYFLSETLKRMPENRTIIRN